MSWTNRIFEFQLRIFNPVNLRSYLWVYTPSVDFSKVPFDPGILSSVKWTQTQDRTTVLEVHTERILWKEHKGNSKEIMWLSTAAGLRGGGGRIRIAFLWFPCPFPLDLCHLSYARRKTWRGSGRKIEKQKEEEVKGEVTSFELIQKWGNRMSMDRTEMWGPPPPIFCKSNMLAEG